MREQKAEHLLLNFFNAMHTWEMKNINKEFSTKDDARSHLNEIFLEYCTLKDRKTGRQLSLSYRNPPEYDPTTQVIKTTYSEGKKIVIETERTIGLKGTYRYYLIEKDEQFRVDKKEMYDSFERKWIKSTI